MHIIRSHYFNYDNSYRIYTHDFIILINIVYSSNVYIIMNNKIIHFSISSRKHLLTYEIFNHLLLYTMFTEFLN
jgi:hypothetical protein